MYVYVENQTHTHTHTQAHLRKYERSGKATLCCSDKREEMESVHEQGRPNRFSALCTIRVKFNIACSKNVFVK